MSNDNKNNDQNETGCDDDKDNTQRQQPNDQPRPNVCFAREPVGPPLCLTPRPKLLDKSEFMPLSNLMIIDSEMYQTTEPTPPLSCRALTALVRMAKAMIPTIQFKWSYQMDVNDLRKMMLTKNRKDEPPLIILCGNIPCYLPCEGYLHDVVGKCDVLNMYVWAMSTGSSVHLIPNFSKHLSYTVHVRTSNVVRCFAPIYGHDICDCYCNDHKTDALVLPTAHGRDKLEKLHGHSSDKIGLRTLKFNH